jgi:hypothetical protein
MCLGVLQARRSFALSIENYWKITIILSQTGIPVLKYLEKEEFF